MTITVYRLQCDPRKVDKSGTGDLYTPTLSSWSGNVATGTLRDRCSITDPVFMLELDDTDVGAFNYLYHQDRKNGSNTAEEYLKKISPLLQERALQLEADRYAELSKESPVFMSGVSLGTNLENALMFPFAIFFMVV